MKKIISVFLCALIFAALSLPVFAADGEDIRTDVELVYAKYRPESDDYSVIVAWGYGFKSPEGEINWYYVFAPDIIPADMFASDGSQAANELLSAVKEGKPIPARTAVELVSESEDGIFVLDSYPPQLVGYSEVKFLGEPQKAYSLTDEAIRKEIDGINSLRSFDNWYPYPDGSYSEAELEVDGRVYRLERGSAVLFEADPGAETISVESDLAPFDGVEYLRIDGSTLAVRPKGTSSGWSVFSAESDDEKNPNTGISGVFSAVFLLGALCSATLLRKK